MPEMAVPLPAPHYCLSAANLAQSQAVPAPMATASVQYRVAVRQDRRSPRAWPSRLAQVQASRQSKPVHQSVDRCRLAPSPHLRYQECPEPVPWLQAASAQPCQTLALNR
jgi:hypothetical protein